MTPEQIALVQQSLGELRDAGDDVVRAFYDRLFATAPDTRALFPDDMASLRASFLATLTEMIAMLDDLPAFALQARDLGARHRRYGVRAGHYAVVGDALLETMEGSLAGFTPAHADAWQQAYTLIAEVMQQGASAAGSGTTLASRRPD
jgi:hemoglobin-like flavoprotein